MVRHARSVAWLGVAVGLALALLPINAHAAEQRRPAAPTVAPAAAAQPPIPYPLALILIRGHLAALQQADETGNYQVLEGLGSRAFQAANPPQRLAQMFAGLRAYNISAVLVTEPKFTELPHLTVEGMLAMRGQYVIDGKLLQFTLIFQPEAGHWRMFGIGADVR